MGALTRLICSGQGQVAGTCECGNEPSGSIKCGELLDQLRTVSFSRRTLLHEASKKETELYLGSFVLKLVILRRLNLEVVFDNITCEDGVLHCITIDCILCWFKHRLGKKKKNPFLWSLHIDIRRNSRSHSIPSS